MPSTPALSQRELSHSRSPLTLIVTVRGGTVVDGAALGDGDALPLACGVCPSCETVDCVACGSSGPAGDNPMGAQPVASRIARTGQGERSVFIAQGYAAP